MNNLKDILANYNYVDLAFFSFLLIFVISGLLRGFIRETFALLNWVIAFLVSYLTSPYLVKLVLPYYKTKIVLDISFRFGIFFAMFLIFIFATSDLSKKIRDKFPKILDKTLGFFIAIAKTILVFGVTYSLYINFYDFMVHNKEKQQSEKLPKFFGEARTSGIIEIAGELVDPATKKFFEFAIKNYGDDIPSQEELNKKIEQILKEKSTNGSDPEYEKLIKESLEKRKNQEQSQPQDQTQQNNSDQKNNNTPQNDPSNKDDQNQGYNKNEIDKKERLMDIVTQKDIYKTE